MISNLSKISHKINIKVFRSVKRFLTNLTRDLKILIVKLSINLETNTKIKRLKIQSIYVDLKFKDKIK